MFDVVFLSWPGRKLSQAEIEAEARKLSRRSNADDDEPLEWGTGLRQKKDMLDEQTRLKEAAKQVFLNSFMISATRFQPRAFLLYSSAVFSVRFGSDLV